MVEYIKSYLGSSTTPGQAGNVFWASVYILLIFLGLSVAVIAMNWLERKILAHMQVRLGPMRVGPHGLLQPIADAIKLLIKEDIMPSQADGFVFWVAPIVVVITAFTVFIVVPFGPTHAVTDMNIGVLFMLGVSSLSVLGIVMAGWASNSHYPLMGALRSSAQMVSYEIAMGLAVVSAVLMTSLNATGTGTLSMIGIVQSQQAQQVWFAFKFFPLGLIAFFVFAVAMVAETNRAPFGLRGRVSHAQASIFPGADDWSGGIRRYLGTDRPPLVSAAGARSYPGYFLVFRQGCFLYVPVHLVSRDLPALSLRSAYESGMESIVASRNRRAHPDRSCGGLALMQPVATTFFFYFLSGLTVIAGVLVITRRNPVHSALALILALLGQAGLYLMLYAPFVAGVQIILYAGGIMVLFLFVIMLVNIEKSQKEEQFNKQWVVGILAAVALGVLFVLVYAKGKSLFPDRVAQLPEQSNTQQIAVMLYGNYMFTFEIASLLLLVAIIGAVVMAKKRI